MLLAAIAFAVSLAIGAPGAPGPIATPQSRLPPTQPGASTDEGVFLVTTADDGSQAIFFVAQSTRHSILPSDLQIEQQLNLLWPVHVVSRQEVLAFTEGTPVGSARAGLLSAQPVAVDTSDDTVEAAQPAAVDAAEPTAEAEASLYVLRPGDNLTSLSARYGTSIQAILDANGLTNANRITSGQTLRVPAAADVASDPDAGAGADEDVAGVTYTVRRGDSTLIIARQFGIDEADLLAANTITNRNHIVIGQVLTIPG